MLCSDNPMPSEKVQNFELHLILKNCLKYKEFIEIHLHRLIIVNVFTPFAVPCAD